jgi:two-component system, OmpR family, response regulator ChvI
MRILGETPHCYLR